MVNPTGLTRRGSPCWGPESPKHTDTLHPSTGWSSCRLGAPFQLPVDNSYIHRTMMAGPTGRGDFRPRDGGPALDDHPSLLLFQTVRPTSCGPHELLHSSPRPPTAALHHAVGGNSSGPCRPPLDCKREQDGLSAGRMLTEKGRRPMSLYTTQGPKPCLT